MMQSTGLRTGYIVPPFPKLISMACRFRSASQSWNASQFHFAPSHASGTSLIGILSIVATHAWKQFVGFVCVVAFGSCRVVGWLGGWGVMEIRIVRVVVWGWFIKKQWWLLTSADYWVV